MTSSGFASFFLPQFAISACLDRVSVRREFSHRLKASRTIVYTALWDWTSALKEQRVSPSRFLPNSLRYAPAETVARCATVSHRFMHAPERVAGIILAAGASRRMGTP